MPTGDEALVPVAVHLASGGKHDVVAVIDPGFTGVLTLPRSIIAALGLTTPVHATDSDPLVGMALLAGYELTIQVVPEGRVTIAALP